MIQKLIDMIIFVVGLLENQLINYLVFVLLKDDMIKNSYLNVLMILFVMLMRLNLDECFFCLFYKKIFQFLILSLCTHLFFSSVSFLSASQPSDMFAISFERSQKACSSLFQVLSSVFFVLSYGTLCRVHFGMILKMLFVFVLLFCCFLFSVLLLLFTDVENSQMR